ncbi:MAG: NAD(P)H-dependent oxidoreductase subunit E [Acidimicrobiales bacterium]
MTDEAMVHLAELVGVTPAEVISTCVLRDVQRAEQAATWSTSAPTSPASCWAPSCCCYAEHRLRHQGRATPHRTVCSIEDVECVAACTEAPCLTVNYRYFYKVDPGDFA